jgi:hypothetical protein
MKWKAWLLSSEFWYNTSFHSAFSRSPFEAHSGRQPRVFGVCPQPAAGGRLEDCPVERANMDELIKLAHAHFGMKNHVDKRLSVRQFTVGNMVYMKLQLYVQSTVATRANHKLSFRYFGPFPMVKQIGSVAYCLQLPAGPLHTQSSMCLN